MHDTAAAAAAERPGGAHLNGVDVQNSISTSMSEPSGVPTFIRPYLSGEDTALLVKLSSMQDGIVQLLQRSGIMSNGVLSGSDANGNANLSQNSQLRSSVGQSLEKSMGKSFIKSSEQSDRQVNPSGITGGSPMNASDGSYTTPALGYQSSVGVTGLLTSVDKSAIASGIQSYAGSGMVLTTMSHDVPHHTAGQKPNTTPLAQGKPQTLAPPPPTQQHQAQGLSSVTSPDQAQRPMTPNNNNYYYYYNYYYNYYYYYCY